MAATAVRRDAATAEFFDGTARGQFLLRHCTVEVRGELAEPGRGAAARTASSEQLDSAARSGRRDGSQLGRGASPKL